MADLTEEASVEDRVHGPEWNAAVVDVRKRLGFVPGEETAIEGWLAEVGLERFLQTTVEAYSDLRHSARYPARLLPYFASCILSHHSGGTWAHSAPPGLTGRLAAVVDELASTYYVIRYKPLRRVPPGHRWEPEAPLLGFVVQWPNWPHVLIEPPEVVFQRMKAINEGVRRRFARRFPVSITWFGVPRIVYGLDDRYYEAPLLFGPAVAGRSVAEVLGLPPEAWAVPTVLPIPLPNFPPGYAFHITLPGTSIQGQRHSGAPIDEWQDARVILDPTAGREDMEVYERVRQVIAWLWANHRFLWEMGGRPPKLKAAPGSSYPELVVHNYRELLRQERFPPSTARLQKLRRKARDLARTQCRGMECKGLKPRWWEEVEREKPWASRPSRSG